MVCLGNEPLLDNGKRFSQAVPFCILISHVMSSAAPHPHQVVVGFVFFMLAIVVGVW